MKSVVRFSRNLYSPPQNQCCNSLTAVKHIHHHTLPFLILRLFLTTLNPTATLSICKQNYCGRDAASHFLKNLASAWRKVKEERKTYSMVLTPEAVIDFKHQTACQICKKNFQNTEDKHRHHDHTRPGPNNLGAL